MVSKSEFYSSGWGLILRRRAKDLLLNSDIVNFLLKANRGRDRRPNFVILHYFNFWCEGGEVGRWEKCENGEVVKWEGGKDGKVVRWGGRRFLVLFKGEGCKVSQKLHLFVSDVNQGIQEVGWVLS